MKKQFIVAGAMLSAGLAAQAAVTYINSDISTSTTLPKLGAGDYYSLTNQVYVLPGATLTIEAGALFKSDLGSLAVSRGAQIFVQGTKDEPVIMTSVGDDFTNWREAANEWGNLTICGNGLISASAYGGVAVTNDMGVVNPTQPTGAANRTMEGLSAAFPGDTRHYYGGNNDNDDSGSIQYLSLRYGGKVIGLGNELNGLSLGGVGEATDIDYVEIMNNVDDGIEIWGGKVHLKHVSIWNIGDDSFDIDQGWRGRAQFGLLVQGYSLNASQGSGVGDNAFEHDGAEQSDAQPVTTAEIYNFTVIGQPDGDHGTTWRDNARVQYRNCIWMDLGEDLVKNDNSDGDGGAGYGFNGTLSWAAIWATSYTQVPTNAVGVPTWNLYTAQSEGYLAQITDSVFYNNLKASAYTTAYSVGVTNAANNNVIAASSPIQSITRAAPVVKGGKVMTRVTYLNPCANNDAATSSRVAPKNGFYSQAAYKGAFSPSYNWLAGWSAADQFGMIDTSMNAAPTVSLDLGASVSFQSELGVSYTVQFRADLMNPWTDLDTVEGTGEVINYVDVGLSNSGFYQVVLN